MRDEKKKSFPLGALALEFLGSALIMLGVAKKFGGMDFFPAITRFDASGWALIVLGFLLTMPLMFYILAKVREKAEEHITQ